MIKKQSSLSLFIFGLHYLKHYKGRLILAIFWSILFVLIPMQLPVIMGVLIDGLTITDKDTPILFYGIINVGETPNEIIFFGFISLLIVAITYGISSFLRIVLRSVISRNFVFELQRALIRKLEFLSLDIHNKYGSGDLLNHTIVDTHNVRPFVEVTIIKTVTNIVRISFPLIILYIIDPFLALVAYSILPLQFFIIRNIQSRITNILKQQRNYKSKLTSLLKENLDGIETIQTSNAEIKSIEKIFNQIDKIEEAQVKSQRHYGMMMGFAWGLTAIGIALTWWLGGLKVLNADITLGQLVIFSSFLVFAYEPVKYFTRDVKDHHRSIIAIKHIQRILETSSSIEEPKNFQMLNILNGKIIFQDVSFSFKKDNELLKNISINIPPKKITVIVGKNGSGKSSILKLIARIYDPSNGQILIDKQNIKNVSLSSLRSQIAVVPQRPLIFYGTILENIKLANPSASDTEVKEACINAEALRFITRFKDGLNTVIGEGAISLSGGEIQRIAIARALLKKAKILILDEPTSSIDQESSSAIIQTLNRLKKDMTIVLVSHHIQPTYEVDNIITIDRGIVVDVLEKACVPSDLNKIINYSDHLKYIYYFNDFVNHNDHRTIEEKNKITSLNHDINDLSIPDKFIEYRVIGKTPEKRNMDIVIIGEQNNPKLKILFIAGQHGDEKYSRKASEELISHLIKTKGKEFPDVSIAVLANANPDGASNNTRRTSSEIDMNRDHLLLNTYENILIHQFINTWRPDLIVDVHNYPPTRKYLDNRNYVFSQDVLIDWPTNLGIRRKLDLDILNNLIKDIHSVLNPFQYSCDRYVLIDPRGKIRHSTNDIIDARNFLSLRYDILTILVEGREPLPEEDQKIQTQRTIFAQYHALLSIIKWAINNVVVLTDDSNLIPYNIGDKIPIRFKYNEPDKEYKINLENKLTKKIEEVGFSNYQYNLRPTRLIKIPYGYAIPSENVKALNLLHRHGFISKSTSDSELFNIEKYLILSSTYTKTKDNPRPPKLVRLLSIEEEGKLPNHEIFLTSQKGGHSLPYLLEPQSEYGLTRYKRLGLSVNPGDTYSIVRVINGKK